jgi:hypothetical protein
MRPVANPISNAASNVMPSRRTLCQAAGVMAPESFKNYSARVEKRYPEPRTVWMNRS